MRIRAHQFFLAVLLAGATLTAQSQPVNLDKKGPPLGTRVPAFSGVDQFGKTQTLESTLKAEGAMLVFFRSADW